MSDIVAVILAAGKGTRMKSNLPKALHQLCGKPMTRHIIDACRNSGIEKCIVVVGFGADEVKQGLGDDVDYVIQAKQEGSGDACRMAVPYLADFDGNVLVTSGDAPLLSSEIINALIDTHVKNNNDATVLTTELDDAAHYGRIIKENNNVIGIVEAKDAAPDQKKIKEINTAIYCFKAKPLCKYLALITNDNAQNEYYLTDVIGLMHKDNYKLGAYMTDDSDAVLGINDRVELAAQTAKLRLKTCERLMREGVTIIDPASTYIDGDAVIGKDTILYPQTYIEGKCVIGEGCIIGPGARLADMTLGNNVTVLFSNLTESEVGNDTKIGPFAHLRPGCKIGNKVKLGNFVEGKKAILEDRVSMGHLSYIGDSTVGEHTNIGAGTITCNYDGYNKSRTVIGKEAFIGSHTTIVAPAELGDGAFTAAGTVVTSDVPGDALAISRPPLTIKDGWVKKYRELMGKEKKK